MNQVKTQQQQMKDLFANEPRVWNDKIKTPNIENLHLMDKETVQDVLSMVCKSRNNIVKIKWVVGDTKLEPVGVDYSVATSSSLAEALFTEWYQHQDELKDKVGKYFEVTSKKFNPF